LTALHQSIYTKQPTSNPALQGTVRQESSPIKKLSSLRRSVKRSQAVPDSTRLDWSTDLNAFAEMLKTSLLPLRRQQVRTPMIPNITRAAPFPRLLPTQSVTLIALETQNTIAVRATFSRTTPGMCLLHCMNGDFQAETMWAPIPS
jgi:hypothetical protein